MTKGHINYGFFSKHKCIVVKIGSLLLVDNNTGRLHRPWLEALASDIERCRKKGQKVIVVSSGAIALGRRYLGMRRRDLRLEEKQAAAADQHIRQVARDISPGRWPRHTGAPCESSRVAPAVGHATSSNFLNSFADICPDECFPTASKTSTTVTSLPLYFPGSIDPP